MIKHIFLIIAQEVGADMERYDSLCTKLMNLYDMTKGEE